MFSANAEAVELCLFKSSDQEQIGSVFLPAFDGEVWHGYIDGLPKDVLYAYRVHGPWQPQQGHRFDATRLLIDPYARGLVGDFDQKLHPPKAQIVSIPEHGVRPPRPDTDWDDTIIYETHVRGYTRQHPQVPQNLRGTYAGLSHPAVIAHLQSLGVTAVELMPCHAFVHEQFLLRQKLVNYWGYNTINFFTPHRQYQSTDSIFEFADMVDRLHEAGLEVILDVVYNHTAEGDHRGESWSYRGIDNASYYRLQPDDRQFYLNYSGCGNTLNVHHPRVMQLVMDSLRYWVEVMGVDGFRFDLATTLCRTEEHFDVHSNFLGIIQQDPVLSTVKMIAEPWDIGPDGYRVGQFPIGWSEWNDRYRDCVRRYWRQDDGQRSELAPRLLGSSDLFERQGRQPWASTNFVTSHDGFTLTDVCSYEHRHNEANGEDNRDGHSDNAGRNWGVEGPTTDAQIIRLRDRHRRNMLATLLLSQGTPMLLAGDEFGRTQQGNNNAYCQDNELTWVDWQGLNDDAEFLGFVKNLIAFRASHPQLRQQRYLHGDSVQWYTPEGVAKTETDWQNDASVLIVVIYGIVSGAEQSAPDDDGPDTERLSAALLLAFNAGDDDVPVTTPPLADHGQWRAVLATEPNDCNSTSAQTRFELRGNSFIVLERYPRA